MSNIDFNTVKLFEEKIAAFFGSPFSVACDSATSCMELALRFTKAQEINVNTHTYLSVAFLAEKLSIKRNWINERWENYYFLTEDVVDGAVFWEKDGYKRPELFGKLVAISHQYQKHLKVGRLGSLLVPNLETYNTIKKMSYDGRLPGIPWREQNISSFGLHYYAQPELCEIALNRLEEAINTKPRQWVYEDWPNLLEMDIFKPKGIDMSDINRELQNNKIDFKSELDKRLNLRNTDDVAKGKI